MKSQFNKVFVMTLAVFLLVVTVFGVTYAWLGIGNTRNNTTVNGTTYNFKVSMDVSSVKSGGLIPVKDDLVLSSLNSNHICEDTRGYRLCSLYKIRFTNSGSTQNMTGNLKTINSTYTSDNLKYQLFSLNGNTYTAISDDGIINNNKNAVNEFKLNNNDVVVDLDSNSNKDVYLVIWLSDPNSNQLVDQDKSFTGQLTFSSNNGDSITSTFINS